MRTANPVTEENGAAVIRLTALWALAESGLGGVMFALHIPFTGFFIGAVAVVLLSLIAQFSRYSYRRIIGATVVVLMVKAAVSPHSPLPAYLAVSFQGVVAALLFSTVRSHKAACVWVGILSMVESSLQKLILLTLLFGKSVWEATNNLVKEIAKTFSLGTDHNYALWIIGGHVLLYAVWGTVVGLFAARAPAGIQKQKGAIIENYNRLKEEQAIVITQEGKHKNRKRWIGFGGVLVFIVVVFALSGSDGKRVIAIILRSVAAILGLIFVVQPVLLFLFRKWLRTRTESERARSQEVMQLLPVLRSFVPEAYAAAKSENGIFNRLGNFLLVMIVLTLYAEQKE